MALILHSSLFNNIHLVDKDPIKLTNPTNIFLKKTRTLCHVFSLNIYEY